jgi:hypothetical protein
MNMSVATLATPSIKVADEVFIVTALLHRENPGRDDFTLIEIVSRAERENIFGEVRPGIRVHASLHCVANRAPNPGRYRMLYATGERTRRLLLAGDDTHPRRDGKIFPEPDEVPAKYRELIEWAQQRHARGGGHRGRWLGDLFQLRGMGSELWRDEHADEYVRRLRKGWQ